MPVTGFRFPTTDTAVSGTWTTPTNVQATDAAYASVSAGKNTTASRDAGGFGFSTAVLPDGAAITKVELRGVYHASVNTSILSFRFNGKVGSTVLANHDDASQPLTDVTVTSDITADRAWSTADFRDGTFFVRFNAVQGNSSTTVTAFFDSVSVQITYQLFDCYPPILQVDPEEDIFDEGRFDASPPPDVPSIIIPITTPLAFLDGFDPVSESLSQSHLTEDAVAVDVSEQIFVVDSLELEPDEPGLEVTHNGAIQPVFDDQAEIVAVDAIELEPDEPGLELTHNGAIQPVFAETDGIVVLPADDDFELDAGLDFFEQKIIDDVVVADVFEQVAVLIAAVDPTEEAIYEVGQFEDRTFDDPPAAGDVAITAPLAFLDGFDFISDSLSEPSVFDIAAVDLVVESSLMLLDRIDLVTESLNQPDVIADAPTAATIAEIATIEPRELDADEYDIGLFEAGSGPEQPAAPVETAIVAPLTIFETAAVIPDSLSEPGIVDEPAAAAMIESSLMILDRIDLVVESFSIPDLISAPIAAADVVEIVAVDAVELEPDEPGLELFQDGSVQPVFASQIEIVAVGSEDDFEPEFGLEYFEQKIVDFTVVPDVSEQIAIIEALELEPDEPGLELISDAAIAPVFADQVEIISLPAEEIEAESEEERDNYRLIQALLIDIDQPILVGALDQPEDEEEILDRAGHFNSSLIENPPPLGPDITFAPLPLDEGEEDEKARELGSFDTFTQPLPPPPPRTVRSIFNRYMAVIARDNTQTETRDNRAREPRGSRASTRRFNTWRSE